MGGQAVRVQHVRVSCERMQHLVHGACERMGCDQGEQIGAHRCSCHLTVIQCLL